jgi:aldehyde dehydrogenase (NAD+)
MTAAAELDTPSVERNGLRHYRLFIDGEWVDTDEHYDVVNPATGEVARTVAKATTEHVDAAVAAARRAFDEGTWRNTPPVERAALIDRVAGMVGARLEEFAQGVNRETGMPIKLARAMSVGFPVVQLQHYAELTRKHEWTRSAPVGGAFTNASFIKKEPIGVTGGIAPWNFPANFAVWKAAPALAAGNSVVVKADEKTPYFGLELAAIFKEAGLPDGVLNVVVGDGPTVGEHMVQHPGIGLITFTGSTAVGRHIMASAAPTLKRVLLELGGKGPNIVLEDANLDLAVDGAIYAFLLHAGQACEGGTRLLLPSSLHDEFIERMVARLGTLRIGDPQDDLTDIGPVQSAQQQERILRYIESGKEQGAQVAFGGGVPEGPEFKNGFWVTPTVLTDVTNDFTCAREEIFGPVLSVIRYDSLDEAIKIANDTPYGLAAGVWSSDNVKALEVADQLDAGSVWINDYHVISSDLPFGGWKQSGLGRELGPDALDEFTQDKSISLSLTDDVTKHPFGLVIPPAGV